MLPAVVVVVVYCVLVLYASDSGSQLWQHYIGAVLVSTSDPICDATGDEQAKLIGRISVVRMSRTSGGTGMEEGYSIATSQ